MTAPPKPPRTPPKERRRIARTTTSSTPIKRKQAPRRVRKTPMAKLRRQLWEKVKQYIRAMHGNTCYTCGAGDLAGSNWQTSHFVNAGESSNVRYDPDNLRPCCYRCNMSLRGNIARYAIHLLDEIGEVKVRALNARSKITKHGGWKRFEIDEMIAALDKGGADYELLYAQKYALINEGETA